MALREDTFTETLIVAVLLDLISSGNYTAYRLIYECNHQLSIRKCIFLRIKTQPP